MRTTAAPRPRSPAQVEASRRNGARSRGPVTTEGKRRSSANALKHGFAALHHLVLDDEDPHELEGLTDRLLAELGPDGELEARLEKAEAAETFDVKRFNAIRGQQAAQGREISRCLKELRLLRREPLMAEQDEPEVASQNEPGNPAPAPAANDDGPRHGVTDDPVAKEKMQDEPEPPVPVDPGAGLGDPALVLGSRVFAAAWNGADRRRQAIQENSAPARGAATGPGSEQAWPCARASLP